MNEGLAEIPTFPPFDMMKYVIVCEYRRGRERRPPSIPPFLVGNQHVSGQLVTFVNGLEPLICRVSDRHGRRDESICIPALHGLVFEA